MELEPKVPPYNTGDRSSFAYVSARDRWPVILTSAIDDVHRAAIACEDANKANEGKSIVENIAKLKYEVQHDRALTPIPDDGQSDIAGYNQELQALGTPRWFDVPWLYAECYLYRRLHTLFSLSTHWRDHDVFLRQKLSTFKSSRPAVLELATRYGQLVRQLQSKGDETGDSDQQQATPDQEEEAEKLLFMEMCEICLWGNATDLSLLTSLTYDDIQKLQGSEARKASEKNILVNHLPGAYEVLRRAKLDNSSTTTTTTNNNNNRSSLPDRPLCRVDIVLDNAGFELFVDLILAGYLIEADLASSVTLHPKSLPWFVSDVTPHDLSALLDALADPQALYAPKDKDGYDDEHSPEEDAKSATAALSQSEVEDLTFLAKHWRRLQSEGRLNVRPDRFWTQAGSYWRLPSLNPKLLEELKTSELVIFKGDLNYRKLTGDAAWDPTTDFVQSIGPMGKGSGVRTLTLRTCKADVVVGLPEGKDEELKSTDGGKNEENAREWAWSGKWAVVQFCDGKV